MRWAVAIVLMAGAPLWGQATMVCMTPAEAKKVYGVEGRGIHYARLVTDLGVSGVHAVLVDDLLVTAEARSVAVPLIVSGDIEALASDRFTFAGRKGQAISIEAFAARLGSRLDPVIRLMDASGKELARCDDDPAGTTPDSRLELALPADGEYVVELRDAAYEGSKEHRYYLRIAESSLPRAREIEGPLEVEPNDSIGAATTMAEVVSGSFHSSSDVDHFRIAGKRGERVEGCAATRSMGWPCDVALKLVSPDGAALAQSKPADADDGVMTHRFAEAGSAVVVVRELNQRSGPNARYRLSRGPARPAVLLAVDADAANGVAGGEVTIKVTATRKDNKGPITLAVPGFEVTNNVIGDGKTETQLKVKLPKDLPAATLHQLRVEGRLKGDDGAIIGSTAAALKRSFPKLLYPPLELQGFVALGIKRVPTTRPTTAPAKP